LTYITNVHQLLASWMAGLVGDMVVQLSLPPMVFYVLLVFQMLLRNLVALWQLYSQSVGQLFTELPDCLDCVGAGFQMQIMLNPVPATLQQDGLVLRSLE
jgi:hypothetical protein